MTKPDQKLLDDIFLQPWFLPRDMAFAVKRIVPPEHRHKMKFFFDDYGCMRCRKRKVTYGSNGLCKPCMQEVKLKLFFAIKRRWTAVKPENLPRTFQRMADAQRLLRDLLSQTSAPESRDFRARIDMVGTNENICGLEPILRRTPISFVPIWLDASRNHVAHREWDMDSSNRHDPELT